MTKKPPKYPVPAADLLGEPARQAMTYYTPPWLYAFPSFKFRHECRPQEAPYDYYAAHPEHRPRPMSRRQLRRLAMRGD